MTLDVILQLDSFPLGTRSISQPLTIKRTYNRIDSINNK